MLLLSGGMDSAAIAAWRRPARCLFIDYGQLPAAGEKRSAIAVCAALDVPIQTVTANCSAVGAGTLVGNFDRTTSAPTPEWWPFRNQLLVTLAAAFAARSEGSIVLIGTVRDDGGRHADGRPAFVDALDALLSQQEGGVHLRAPAIEMSGGELIEASGIADNVLAWTHSCHVASSACGSCTGCRKRRNVLDDLGRLP